MIEDIHLILHSVCHHWLEILRSSDILKKPLPEIRCDTFESADLNATAQIWPGEPLQIEVANAFLNDVTMQVEGVILQVEKACLDGIEYSDGSDSVSEIVAMVAAESILSFVILHEIFHVLCGHIEERLSHSSANLAFDESFFGISSDAIDNINSDNYQVVREQYYKELEADNCALQALTQLPVPNLLNDVLSMLEGDESDNNQIFVVDQCSSLTKVIAYRFLLVASWQIVVMMENRRGESIRKRFHDHPYPGARLLAAISTLMEQFSGVFVDKAGNRTVALDENTSKEMRVFTDAVLKPVLKQEWPIKNMPDVISGFEVFPVWIVQDTLNLLKNGQVETPAGRELRDLDTTRSEMYHRLATYRYY